MFRQAQLDMSGCEFLKEEEEARRTNDDKMSKQLIQSFFSYFDKEKAAAIPKALEQMEEILMNGWRPICEALYHPGGWVSESLNVETFDSTYSGTINYQMTLIRTDSRVFPYKIYSDRKFEIASIIDARGDITFKLKTKIGKNAPEEVVYKFPEQMNTLTQSIEEKLKFRWKRKTISSRYEAHIQHVSRLLNLSARRTNIIAK